MKTPKKASVKAQAFASKLTGSEVAKSTTWATITDIINEHFPYVYDLHTNCKANGDNTVIKLYKGDETATKDDIIEIFSLPNSEVFIEKEGDWEWPTIHKLLVEYFMKNWKKLTSGKKTKSKKKQEPINTNELMKRVAELQTLIKDSKGKEKKVLVAEFNEKSKLLDSILEAGAAKAKAEQEARKASAEDLDKLRKRKQALSQRIKEWTSKGKDTNELAKELAQVTKELTEAKTGTKR